MSSAWFTDAVPELHLYTLQPKANTSGAVLFCIVLVVYAALVISSAWVWILQASLLLPILSSCNIILLGVTGILQKHLVSQQKKEQWQGYLKFSKRLQSLVYVPFTIVAFGTAGILLVVSWQSQEHVLGISPILLIRVIILVEISVTEIVVAIYVRKVYQHHAFQLQPDVMHSLYSALQPPTSLGGLRYNEGGLAEQQAILLHYQQDNIRHLSEEILKLQETLSKYKGSHSQRGSTPEVDVVHLLAAREQELRAITAERDQLTSELRLARSLIAERDGDILRIRTINDQYVEENERIRAMLDEWSTRTAKLEIVLEAERLSNADLHAKLALSLQQSRERDKE